MYLIDLTDVVIVLLFVLFVLFVTWSLFIVDYASMVTFVVWYSDHVLVLHDRSD